VSLIIQEGTLGKVCGPWTGERRYSLLWSQDVLLTFLPSFLSLAEISDKLLSSLHPWCICPLELGLLEKEPYNGDG
jgi:hypothetical protein